MADNILDIANQFRAALLKKERKAAVRLVTTYGGIWSRLSRQLEAITRQIQDARAKGELVNQAWLFRQQRYGDLLRQVDREFRRFADVAEASITKQQRQAVNAALGDSVSLMETAADDAGVSATFNKLPTAAVENLVGFLGNGSPLSSLLNQLPRAGRAIVEEGLTQAVALGIGPAATARKIREGLGGNLTRALTVSRTEILRAYRTASSQNYKQNADVLEGWVWLSAKNSRSCAACIALHGTFHPVNEPMKSHVRCRCTQVPQVKGSDLAIEKGSDWFARQDAKTQRDILGTDVGYKAYKAGQLKLQDFVGLKRNSVWGESYYQLGVKRARAGEGAWPGDAARLRDIIPPKIQPQPKPKSGTMALKEAEAFGAKWEQGLTPDQIEATRAYQGGDHVLINKYLRGETKWPFKLKPGETPKDIRDIDAAIEKAKLPKPIEVYRGIGSKDLFEKLQKGQLKIGNSISEKAYSSTSMDRSLAERYLNYGGGEGAQVLMRIKAPKGAKAAYLSNPDGPFGMNAVNQEFLLARGADFKITGVTFEEIKGVRTAVVDVDAVQSTAKARMRRK